MSKILSAEYFQQNKERLQKKLAKDIKIFLMKKKSSNMVVNFTNISHKMENKSLLGIAKYIESERKCLFIKSNDSKSSKKA